MIAATALCWQGMVRDSDDFSLLEEGRWKLLVASVLPGLGAAAEVARRLTLWEESRFEDHLRRAEEQLLITRKAGTRKQRDVQPNPWHVPTAPAERLLNGANRKATGSPQARSPRPPCQRDEKGSRGPSRWESSCPRPVPSGL